MSYIDPRGKLFYHMDRLLRVQQGQNPPPVNVEIDLSNRCSLGCEWCLTHSAMIDTINGRCSIAEVKPGDIVLAYDERIKSTVWTSVIAVSRRITSDTRIRVTAGNQTIEATENHRVYTKRGWIEAGHISINDEVAYVPEIVRVWLRSSGEMQGVSLLSRTQQYAGIEASEQRAHETQEPDAQFRSDSACSCQQTKEECCSIGNDQAANSRWGIQGQENYTGRARTDSETDARKQSDAQSSDFSESGRVSQGQWIVSETVGSAQALMGKPGISSGASTSHEKQQSNVQCGCCREEPGKNQKVQSDEQTGTMVWEVLPAQRYSRVVHGNGRILGTWAQPGLQNTWGEIAYRGDGRLLSQAGEEDSRQLCATDYPPLRGAWLRVSSSYASGETAESYRRYAGEFDNGYPSTHGYEEKRCLEFYKVTSIERVNSTQLTEVFNLETATGTYFANSLLVHNCHFGFTHTRGPLAGRHAKPENHTPGGDLMELEMARSIIEQLAEMGTQSITWTGGGEPTLHPDFDEIMRLAYYAGLDQGVYTNGCHIDGNRAALLKRVTRWVYVSLDAHDAADYKRAKGVDKFKAACDGVRELAGAGGNATIGVGFLLTEQNWRHAFDMLHLARGLGADYAQFRPTVRYDIQRPGHIGESTGWMDEMLQFLQPMTDEPDVQLDMWRFDAYRDWTEHGYNRCWWANLQTVITPNGKVWTCVNKREHAADEIGDLNFEQFADIWANRGAVMVDETCRVMCRGHVVNSALAPAFERDVEHGSFI